MLGEWIEGRFEGRYDYGFIRTSKRATTTAVIFNRARVERLKAVASPNAMAIGQVVCMLGIWHSKPKCGKVFQKDHSGELGDGHEVYQYARVHMEGVEQGDSGASVVSPTGQRIWGIASAANDDEMLFAWAKHIFTSQDEISQVVECSC